MKKNIVFILIAILLMSFVLTACGGEQVEAPVQETVDKAADGGESKEESLSAIDKIKQSGKLVMGTNADYPPFEFHAMIDGKDEIVGLDIAIAKYIADDLGVTLEIKDMDFSNLLGAVGSEMIDIIVAAMNPTPERLEEANFSDIYYEADIAVLVKKDDNREYKTEDDLIGKTIGVQLGTTQEEVANDIEDALVKSFGTNSDAIMNLKTGKVDCVLMESVVTSSFAKVNEDIIVADGLVIKNLSEGTAIATQKGNDDLVEYMNSLIDEMKEKGLVEEWFLEAQELSEQNID
ncbi:MAG: transporter substrate-binding domain-containing protein [Tissierellaceae bacterium]|nr:transporter substrate-binding domain-containing protein [Tissierellaceae bacterium]